MVEAVRDRGVRVKWIVHTAEAVAASPTLRLQHDLLGAPAEEEETHLRTRVEGLLDELKQRTSPTTRERWEIFQSTAPHPFMAFLAVPGSHSELSGPDLDRPPPGAPPGTFGFVYPYPMYIHTLGAAPGLLLQTPDDGPRDIVDYYYRSVLWTFSRGGRDGFLARIWPVKPAGD